MKSTYHKIDLVSSFVTEFNMDKDLKFHGEYVAYDMDDNILIAHSFYRHGEHITEELKKEYGDLRDPETRFIISLKEGLPMMNWDNGKYAPREE